MGDGFALADFRGSLIGLFKPVPHVNGKQLAKTANQFQKRPHLRLRFLEGRQKNRHTSRFASERRPDAQQFSLSRVSPLEDISNTRRINAVVVNGKHLPKEKLQKMLADAEAAANKK